MMTFPIDENMINSQLQALGHQKLSNTMCNVLKETFRKEELQQRAWLGQNPSAEESPKKTHHAQPSLIMIQLSRDKHARPSIDLASHSNQKLSSSASIKNNDVNGRNNSNCSTFGSRKTRPHSPLKSTCSSAKESTSHCSSISKTSTASKASIVSNATSSSTSSNNIAKAMPALWFSNISDLVDSTDIGWGVRSERNVTSDDKDFFLDLQPVTSTKYSKKKVIETEFYDHSHFGKYQDEWNVSSSYENFLLDNSNRRVFNPSKSSCERSSC